MEKGKGNPLAYCPYCDKQLDGYTSIDKPDATPKEGDFSLCWGCRRLLVFRADQTLRKATFKEHNEFETWLRKTRTKRRRKKMN